jgi:energy-coupling factor transporter ATP-binding protein EcfA2
VGFPFSVQSVWKSVDSVGPFLGGFNYNFAMSTWDEYPETYRAVEVQRISQAVCAGECAAVIGLSGSGKSNLMGFLARRVRLATGCPRLILVDCNRVASPDAKGFFSLLQERLAAQEGAVLPKSTSVEAQLAQQLEAGPGVGFVLDRFDALFNQPDFFTLGSNLRALRDEFKYRLTFVTAARRPLPPESELAELFFGATLWLGPLAPADARWSAGRDAARYAGGGAARWGEAVIETLVRLSWGYPALLRAACEAYAAGAALSERGLRDHPAITRRVAEFWADHPTAAMLEMSGLAGHPWLEAQATRAGLELPAAAAQVSAGDPDLPAAAQDAGPRFDLSLLTAQEMRLWQALSQQPGEVCDKDALVKAVCP